MLKTSRNQLEGRFKTARKFVLDMEKASKDNQSWPTPLNKSAITARYSSSFKSIITESKIKRLFLSTPNSLPEIPLKEDLGGIWSVIHADEAHAEIEKIVMSCGSVCEQPPYRISDVLQLPASLRLKISQVRSYHHPVRFISLHMPIAQ